MVLVLTETDVETLAEMKGTVARLETAFREQSEGRVLLPDRQVLQESGSDAVVRLMAASVARLRALGLKALLGTPADRKPGSTYFAVLLFDDQDASLLAIISAARLTQLRTGAASGIATKHLARADVATIGLVGAGVQGFGQLEGVAAVANLRGGLVFDLNQGKASDLVERAKSQLGLTLKQAEKLEDLYGVDVLCTATTSIEPVIFGDRIEPGIHINAIGSNAPGRQELHESVLLRSKVFVDRKQQALKESGDFLVPIQKGLYDPSHIVGELCDVLTGKIEGRRSKSEITLFKSVGIALEDIAIARFVYELAVGRGAGQEIHL